MQSAAFTKNWSLFETYFTQDVYYRVGNVMESKGPAAIAKYLRDLPATELAITGQEVRANWQTPDEVLAEYTMRATRLADNRSLVYPCMDIYRFRGDMMCDWRVYPIQETFIDPDSAVTLRPPSGTTLAAEPQPPASLATVHAFQRALREADWASAASCLTGDAVLRVANGPEVSGPEAILRHLGGVFTRIRPTGASFVGIWDFDDALVTEMNVQATRMSGNQSVEYPCVETHRFSAGKIREWRIYPIESALLTEERMAHAV
jgi:ketosteroid isomerase-like protein